MQLRGGGPREVDLIARVYFGAFVVALLAAALTNTPHAVALKQPRPSTTTTQLVTTTSAAPAPPVVPPPVAAVLGPDLEHSLPTPTAPDGRPAVVLTFDDGPHPYFTPRVLDILKSRGVKAVFCLVGWQIERYPQFVARIAAEGHALCDHTENHDTRMSQKDLAYVAAMIQHPADLIRDITGAGPTFYRGPGGDLSVFIIERAHELGMRILGWSVDPVDYFTPGASVIQDRVMARVHPGSIILMHDGGGERSQTVEQLAGLIDRLAAAGYAFVLP